ncbi:hypothetical protein [Acidovorax sp. SUPP2539]|uniref:hypothetical protein n=1 Tax=Acidovorax sp. SUPP2539 TaxID=2920878 RepID=UPI0023DE6633|nr:hypothetical protein [Acidovorax sp. SUPP2539]GKS88089.1 hypothetical protein AVTE2539_02010 [Acidovorax sp. SUPP2539]
MSDGNQGNTTTTRYDYQSLNGSCQQTGSSATRGSTSATTWTWRDANGFVSNIEQTTGVADERFNRAFVNDAQGNAVYVNQGAGHTGRVQNQPGGYVVGGWVGDSLNPGHVQRQLVANGEVLARYGDAPDSENPPANAGEIPKYVDTAEFRLNAAPLKLKGANLDAIAYTVVGGETLKDIARNVLDDAKLWWRIAEANGLALSGLLPCPSTLSPTTATRISTAIQTSWWQNDVHAAIVQLDGISLYAIYNGNATDGDRLGKHITTRSPANKSTSRAFTTVSSQLAP